MHNNAPYTKTSYNDYHHLRPFSTMPFNCNNNLLKNEKCFYYNSKNKVTSKKISKQCQKSMYWGKFKCSFQTNPVCYLKEGNAKIRCAGSGEKVAAAGCLVSPQPPRVFCSCCSFHAFPSMLMESQTGYPFFQNPKISKNKVVDDLVYCHEFEWVIVLRRNPSGNWVISGQKPCTRII